MSSKPSQFDVIVVGAGFAGLYSLHRLRSAGYSVRVLEAGDEIGGTWFWNRYPGARCDIESMQYSFSFSDEIQQQWEWSQLFAPQPEILRYINFVADKLSLRKDIQLATRVVAAAFDETTKQWEVRTSDGERLTASFCVMATGCLSIPIEPRIEGLKDFERPLYRTSDWPRGGVDFAGKRVGLVGTGSSGIQATPHLAAEAAHLTVFQRTPNYSLPARNRPSDPDYTRDWKQNYRERRLAALKTRNNTLNGATTIAGSTLTHAEREAEFERRWALGGSSSGIGFMYSFTDMTRDKMVNAHASQFVRDKIAATVKDPETARLLTPGGYGIGGKRICVDTGYYETFNRPNVSLVDVKTDPIERFTATGIRLRSGREVELDIAILAIGFDAFTGALARIDVTGNGGIKLADRWRDGPRTLFGMAIAEFPNLFMINGPGSPSVLSNMVTSIEQHVNWIASCIDHVKRHGSRSIEVRADAEASWVTHVSETAATTLMPNNDSWYVGANVPGKPRVFMPYLGGTAKYNAIIDETAAAGYPEFIFR
jgi:cyclohexanone monooxygenase